MSASLTICTGEWISTSSLPRDANVCECKHNDECATMPRAEYHKFNGQRTHWSITKITDIRKQWAGTVHKPCSPGCRAAAGRIRCCRQLGAGISIAVPFLRKGKLPTSSTCTSNARLEFSSVPAVFVSCVSPAEYGWTSPTCWCASVYASSGHSCSCTAGPCWC